MSTFFNYVPISYSTVSQFNSLLLQFVTDIINHNNVCFAYQNSSRLISEAEGRKMFYRVEQDQVNDTGVSISRWLEVIV